MAHKNRQQKSKQMPSKPVKLSKLLKLPLKKFPNRQVL